ncbi:MAG: hypothetical protein EPO23_02265 [Xanthobacteraceae bacterium]|nr:MAG: hypothetical protein EPO23_02265 [Xanthobacteraceae bacterium]
MRAAARFAHVQVLDYGQLARCADFATLRGVYVHLSGKPQRYELDWCLGRYFLLRDHFHREDIDGGWLLDSDFLLLAPLPESTALPPGTRCALSFSPLENPLEQHASSHCAYWTREALESFCAFILMIYRDNSASLVTLDKERRAAGIRSAISDMILLGLWARGAERVFDLFDFVGAGLIDHNLRMDMQPRGTRLRMMFGAKKLIQRHGRVFATASDGQLIAVCGLHFQGGAKMLMADVAAGRWLAFTAKAAARAGYDWLRLRLRKLKKKFNVSP